MFSTSLAGSLKSSGLRVVVTGGTSWLGRASLSVLENAFGSETADRVLVFGSRAQPLRLPSGRIIESRNLADIAKLPSGEYAFLHYAFITKGHVGEHSLSDYVRLNKEIADTVEAAARRLGAIGFFLPSSGAVYRKDRTLHTVLDESPYGVMKLDDERRFAAMSRDTGCRLMPIRVFNVAGPGINNIPAFVLSSIIADVLSGRPVVLRAMTPVFRSYIHVVDLVELVLSGFLAKQWTRPEPFDTAGEAAIEVGDLAKLVVDLMGVPNHPILRPAMQNEPADRYVGERAAFVRTANALGLTLKSLETAVLDTVTDLKERGIGR